VIERNAAACDGPGCNTWSRVPEEHGFMMLVWGAPWVFCSGDCAMRWLSENTKPLEVVE
jgi:hypothetical protein